MRFIAFWDYDPKDMKEIFKIMGKCGSGLDFVFSPSIIGGQHKGFTIFETDDMDKITTYVTHYAGLVNMTVYPLEEAFTFFKKYMEKHPELMQ